MKNKQTPSAVDLIVSLAFIGAGTFISAFTVAYLWNNIVSVILGVTTITMIQALALDWFWMYFSSQLTIGEIKQMLTEDKEPLARQFEAILKTLFWLGSGWVIIQFL